MPSTTLSLLMIQQLADLMPFVPQVLVHAPPLVIIEDAENKQLQDPGNVLQSRTIANGKLSGLVIDLLSHIQVHYMYPCARQKAAWALIAVGLTGLRLSESTAKTVVSLR